MNWSAIEYNKRGMALEEEGKVSEAEALYRQAIDDAPQWSVPWYNLGLLYKRQRQWSDSLACNRRAVELDPSDAAAWWNLGIAATALGDWPEARRAWVAYGIEIPPGEGSVKLDLGPTPIRINPQGDGEVLWCWRIDPARAVIRSIPLPESHHRFDDLLLHDGAPNGYRVIRGKEVPVFDELEILEPSAYSTFEVVVDSASPEDTEALKELALEHDMGVEDWSATVRMLCKLCSEGRPHETHQWQEESEPTTERRFGFAAHSEREVHEVLKQWLATTTGCDVISLRCVLQSGSIN